MSAFGHHHYCRHLGLSPRGPSGPRTVDLGVCNNDGGLRPPSIILYFYIEKWTFKGMCEVYYRAKRDKKEATCL